MHTSMYALSIHPWLECINCFVAATYQASIICSYSLLQYYYSVCIVVEKSTGEYHDHNYAYCLATGKYHTHIYHSVVL